MIAPGNVNEFKYRYVIFILNFFLTRIQRFSNNFYIIIDFIIIIVILNGFSEHLKCRLIFNQFNGLMVLIFMKNYIPGIFRADISYRFYVTLHKSINHHRFTQKQVFFIYAAVFFAQNIFEKYSELTIHSRKQRNIIQRTILNTSPPPQKKSVFGILCIGTM